MMNLDRRDFLMRSGSGCGMLALSALMQQEKLAAAEVPDQAVTSGGKAKSVIWLFMNGGPSGIDIFDYKPELTRRDGEPFPGKIKTLFPYPGNIMGTPFKFKQYGQSGAWVSDVYPHIAKHVDNITFLNACVSNEQNHAPACYVVNTGSRQTGFPHLGSWATYGLGSERVDIPEFVVMYDYRPVQKVDRRVSSASWFFSPIALNHDISFRLSGPNTPITRWQARARDK